MVKKAFFIVSLLVGLALLAFVVAHLRLERIPETLGEIGWLAVLAYVANASLTLVIPALSWTILMRSEGMRVSYWTALKANLMGWPLNFVTPTLYLGGEPLKTFYIANVANEPKRRVLATIIVTKFQEFGALLLVMLVAAGISIWRIELTPRDEVLTLISMVILSALFGLTLCAFIGNFKPTVRFITFLARLGLARRRLARLRSRARDMEQIIHRAFTKRWKTTIVAQAITLLSAVSILMRAWIFFYFAGKLLDTGQICGLYVITYIANSLPIPYCTNINLLRRGSRILG